MSIFDTIALLLGASALFGWLNSRFLRLPNAVGMLAFGLAASLLLILADFAFPEAKLDEAVRSIREFDFARVLIDGMLAFLLFAAALNVKIAALRERLLPVVYLAVFGTVISIFLVGVMSWLAASLIGVPISFAWALVFGAIISPTDPIAVSATLKNISLRHTLRVEAEGESLINDGIAIVLFTLLLGFATGDKAPGALEIGLDVLREAGGAVLLGLITGYVAYRALRAIDDFPIEVLITLALVAVTYTIAQRIAVSGPLATVTAALLVSHRAPHDALSDETQNYVSAVWTLIDEILNAILFLLIGLEVLLIDREPPSFWFGLAAIPIVLGARFVAVALPVLIPFVNGLDPLAVPFLTWGAVRGGISVALALALPFSDARPAILTATYLVVLFSIIVQGLTLRRLVERLGLTEAGPDDPA